MSTCQTWEAPYNIDGVQGATPEGVCAAYAVAASNQWGDPKPVFPWSLSGDTCTVDQSQFGQSSVATVVHVCDAATQNELAIPPLQLTAAQGAEIAAAILGCWAAGYVFRVVIRALSVGDKTPDSHGE